MAYKFKIGDKVKITSEAIFKLGESDIRYSFPKYENITLIVVGKSDGWSGIHEYALNSEDGEKYIAWVPEIILEKV
jgi:hypothetical protein